MSSQESGRVLLSGNVADPAYGLVQGEDDSEVGTYLATALMGELGIASGDPEHDGLADGHALAKCDACSVRFGDCDAKQNTGRPVIGLLSASPTPSSSVCRTIIVC